MTDASTDVTHLLSRWSDGEREALDALVPIVYERLRAVAHRRRGGERFELTLNTTGLVHEAYLKLVELRQTSFRDRGHFLAMASRVMRRLLVDHARAHRARKRGGGVADIELEETQWVSDERADAFSDLDEALDRLETVDPRASRVLEQRYFGGLSLEETAEASGVSLATVKRDLRFARAWIAAELRVDSGAADA
jgi:RNA polymerase sigma factor (TIGR02999 family)